MIAILNLTTIGQRRWAKVHVNNLIKKIISYGPMQVRCSCYCPSCDVFARVVMVKAEGVDEG